MAHKRRALCCLARDIKDRALLETLGYFYPGERVAFHIATHHIDRLLDYVQQGTRHGRSVLRRERQAAARDGRAGFALYSLGADSALGGEDTDAEIGIVPKKRAS